jgi:hypothetical protein
MPFTERKRADGQENGGVRRKAEPTTSIRLVAASKKSPIDAVRDYLDFSLIAAQLHGDVAQ